MENSGRRLRNSPNNLPLLANIDNATGKVEIADMWKDPHTIFDQLLIEIFLLLLILTFQCLKPELCISFCFSYRSGSIYFFSFAIIVMRATWAVRFLVNNNYTTDPRVIQI